MQTAILFDCEFLAIEGSQRRFWCGPYDPVPQVVQIGAVRLALERDFALLGTYSAFVRPVDRRGQEVPVDPFLTELTGVTQAQVSGGVGLARALADLEAFAGGAMLWSWGGDERHLVAISCYEQGIAPPIPATRFGNACGLMLAAGMPYADIQRTSSSGLAAYHGCAVEGLRAHDALADATSLALAVQCRLRAGDLGPGALISPA